MPLGLQRKVYECSVIRFRQRALTNCPSKDLTPSSSVSFYAVGRDSAVNFPIFSLAHDVQRCASAAAAQPLLFTFSQNRKRTAVALEAVVGGSPMLQHEERHWKLAFFPRDVSTVNAWSPIRGKTPVALPPLANSQRGLVTVPRDS